MSDPPSKGGGVLANYLTPQAFLEREINALIARYDPMEVRSAVMKLTKQRPGRKSLKDFVGLREDLERDAEDWLEGRNPLEERKNYSIAKRFAEKNPGHSRPATMRRIQRKLADKREWIGLVVAMDWSETSHPYSTHLAMCDKLAAADNDSAFIGRLRGDTARGIVDRYRHAFGDPEDGMTLATIRDEAETAAQRQLQTPETIGGLLAGVLGTGSDDQQ